MPALDGFKIHRVTIERRLATGADGIPSSYSDPLRVRGKVEAYERMVYTDGGERRTATARVFLPPETEVVVGDRLTLPDGSAPPILSVATVYDGKRAAYKAVVL